MADLAATDLTYAMRLREAKCFGRHGREIPGSISFGDSALTYPSGGIPLSKGKLGAFNEVQDIKIVEASTNPGYHWEFDKSANKLRAYEIAPAGTLSLTVNSGAVADDDSAASNGVALYFHTDEVLEEGSILGHFEFVSPTNADTYFAIGSGGPTVNVLDDDAAATAGLAVYFDEDAAATDGRFLVDLDLAGDRDAFVMASDGSLIRINDDDSASSNGVQVYLDEDAANDYEKLLFVSPTDTAGAYDTDDAVSMQGESLTFAGTDGQMVELDGGSDAPAATVLEIIALVK